MFSLQFIIHVVNVSNCKVHFSINTIHSTVDVHFSRFSVIQNWSTLTMFLVFLCHLPRQQLNVYRMPAGSQ